MNVLVADDSLIMRRLLTAYLRPWGYEVLEAKDGEEAWSLFQSESVSLVLTDWIMPNVDGLELIRRIRASPRPGYCYLILLTAKSEKEDLVTAMEAGADDFLVKPCDKEELRVRLREGERIIRLERELAQQNRQLRETQAALIQSEKLASLGQLAAGMAHEINNPIAFVTNNLAVLRRDLGDMTKLIDKYQLTKPVLQQAAPELHAELIQLENDCDLAWLREQLPRLLQSSASGLARVRDIVTNLRDFARLDQAAYDTMELGKAVQATLEMLNRSIEEKRLTVETEDEHTPPLLCQPDKILQVLYNVVLNAVQASTPDSKLSIRIKADSECAILEVQDFGVGMTDATRNRVFEPFFTTKPVGEGTGLGMAVSYGIVIDHGGRIAIESELHRGTTVQVRLPFKPPPRQNGQTATS